MSGCLRRRGKRREGELNHMNAWWQARRQRHDGIYDRRHVEVLFLCISQKWAAGRVC